MALNLFGGSVPPTIDGGDPDAIELGIKIAVDADSLLTGVRFYKASANTGTHTGRLWAASGGTLLASKAFSEETASGWQEVLFDTPVALTAGQTYVASVHCPAGHYSYENSGLASAHSSGILRSLAGATESPNGVFKYGAGGTYPDDSFGNSNYWVDVLVATAATIERSAGITATATIAATGSRDLQRGASLSATTDIAASGQRELQRAATLTAAATLATSGQRDLHRAAALTATTTITATGTRELPPTSAPAAAHTTHRASTATTSHEHAPTATSVLDRPNGATVLLDRPET